MKKQIIFILLTLCILGAGYYKKNLFVQTYQKIKTLPTKEPTSNIQSNTGQTMNQKAKSTPQEINKEIVRKKIQRIKQKYAMKELIEEGEQYLKEKEYRNSIIKNLQILKKLPNEKTIIEKIAFAYFKIKKFHKSYEYYEKIKDYKKLDKHTAINSFIFSQAPTLKQNIPKIKKELPPFFFTEEELFYYTNSLNCIEDINLCKEAFKTYFTQAQNNTKEIAFTDLQNIQSALTNYKNFKLDDSIYENALITGAFFSNGLYPITIHTGENILKEKPNYKPIIKIIAKSYFELGQYIQAKKYLLRHNEIDEADAEVSYLLGVIYGKLRDYVLSSIHLKKSIEIGYPYSIDARKRIIYNYHKVGETEKMLSILKKMVTTEQNITIQDIELALYQHIINQRIAEAREIIKFAMEKYSLTNTADEPITQTPPIEADILYGYLGWIQLEETNIEGSQKLSEKNLNKGLAINPNNAMIHYVLGKLKQLQKQNKQAKIHFKKTIDLGTIDEFTKLATKAIQELNH